MCHEKLAEYRRDVELLGERLGEVLQLENGFQQGGDGRWARTGTRTTLWGFGTRRLDARHLPRTLTSGIGGKVGGWRDPDGTVRLWTPELNPDATAVVRCPGRAPTAVRPGRRCGAVQRVARPRDNE
jgi:hypothetical protein